MYPTEAHLRAVKAIDAVYDRLVERGLQPYTDEAWKRRDPREPGRYVKEAYEDRIVNLVMRYFRLQKRKLREYLEFRYPARKALEDEIPEDILKDAAIAAAFYALFAGMSNNAIDMIFAEMSIPFNVLEYTPSVMEIARQQVGTLIKQIDQTTLDAVRQAVAGFVETPGMTIGDLIESLPFNKIRARMIAVSEVTNMYGAVELEVGHRMQNDYPGALVIHTWFTNNDPNVCEICRSLDGQTVLVGEPFISDYGVFYRPGEPHPQDRCWLSTRTVIANAP